MATRKHRARPAPSGSGLLSLNPEQRRELTGISLVAAAVLCLLALLLPGNGRLVQPIHGAQLWLAGWGVLVLPVSLASLGVAVLRRGLPPAQRVVGWLAAGLALLGLIHVVFVPVSRWPLFYAHGGGMAGYAMAGSLHSLLGIWGALVVLLALLAAGVVLATDISLVGVARRIYAGATSRMAEAQRLRDISRRAGSREAQGGRVRDHSGSQPEFAFPGMVEFQGREPMAETGSVPSPIMAGAVAGSTLEPVVSLAGAALGEGVEADLDQALHQAEARALRRAASPPVAPILELPLDAIEVDLDEEPPPPRVWKMPPLSLLETSGVRRERLQDEIKRNVQLIEQCLRDFGVDAKVIGVNPGPAITQYELQPGMGVPVKKITALGNDLALALAASPLRIEAPIPGKSAVGLEVPNRSTALVNLKEVLVSEGSGGPLKIALGKDVSGQPVVGDLARMPHLLIAGSPGSGKSVCINTIAASILMQNSPESVKLLLIDPKRVELTQFNDIPHLLAPVVVEAEHAAGVLRWCVTEMDRRYKLLAANGVRNIQAFNERAPQEEWRPLPYIVVIIDELADLMMVAANEVEEVICRIAQLARAVGIHLVVATQRPSADIVTGLIKANIPSRIAFAVSSGIDSRVVLDAGGAEKLLGRGDMLYQPVDAGKPVRLQGAFVSDRELENICNFWKEQGPPAYERDVLSARQATLGPGAEDETRQRDPLFARAAKIVATEGVASVSLIQRKFNVGYSRAGRIVDQLAEHGVVGGYVGSKSREVLMSLFDVDELLERLDGSSE